MSEQNDELVERLLGICGYINFLEAVFMVIEGDQGCRNYHAVKVNNSYPETSVRKQLDFIIEFAGYRTK